MIKRFIALIGAVITIAGGAKMATVPKKSSDQSPEVMPIPYIQYDGGAVYVLSQNEYDLICRVVMGESGGEPYVGQLAVAQTILNTCRIEKRRPPETIKTHGYTSWRPEPSESVQNAVTEVFADGREVLDRRVTMFYAPTLMKNGYSADHESQIYSTTIGGHKFFIEWRYADVVTE